MSGIPWWTTDIGGFYGGDIHSTYFRELIVRWFQYGVFCPICRLHGHRSPILNPLPQGGADNEVWSFGEQVYAILRQLLFLRERLRPYIHQQMQIASETGLPVMRPLFVDFPNDTECETVDDQFMFGSEILVAPVLYEGARERRVYLPAVSNWLSAGTGAIHAGGQWINAAAPLETIPIFVKEGSDLQGVFHSQ
jgi:alpha-D-xyloside xylohydrolase